jgi:hypothetical protein
MTDRVTNWKSATVLLTIGKYKMLEHPTRGDTDQVYMQWDGKILGTGFYDLGDFDLCLCEELASEYCELLGLKA